MKRSIVLTLGFLLVSLAFSGCKLQKVSENCAVTLDKLPRNVQTDMAENLVSFTDLSMRIKADYKEGENKQGFAMNVKMKRDSFVWASVSVMIEAARAFITPDSFVLLDRINRKYYKGAITDLKRFTGQELTLRQLQDLLVGNPVFLIDMFQKKNDELRNDYLQHQSSGVINNVQVSGCYRTTVSEFSSIASTSKFKVEYKGFQKEKGLGIMPHLLDVTASGKGKTYNLLMEYGSISTEPIPSLTVTIPSKYEKGN